MLKQHGLRPDKRFGQHFLVSEKIVSAIVGQVSGCRSALEVGPGPGVLTNPLCSVLDNVRVVEVDEAIIPVLREMAPSARVTVGDALQTDLSALLADMTPKRALVSNMPYNITGPLLTRFAACSGLWDVAVLMMQREVGDRVLAPAGSSERGSLSVFIQAQFRASVVCHVPAGAFLPPPKVESVVLRLEPCLQVDLDVAPKFFDVVRAGFTQPRKTLANNLAPLGGRAHWETALDAAELPMTVRPHQLSLGQWQEVASRAPE